MNEPVEMKVLLINYSFAEILGKMEKWNKQVDALNGLTRKKY